MNPEFTLHINELLPYEDIINLHKTTVKEQKKKFHRIGVTVDMSKRFWNYQDIEIVRKLLKRFHVILDGQPEDILRLIPHLPKSKKLTLSVNVEVPHIDELKKYGCVVKIKSENKVWYHDLEKLTKRG